MWKLPPKWSHEKWWAYTLFPCMAKAILRCFDQEKHFAKRMDQIGALYQKLGHFEFPCTPCDQMTITSQPFIIWTWIRTFWKGETKIYNFHVHQKSIWSFFDVDKSSWMWTKNLPNLETLNYRSFSIFGNFWFDFKNLQDRCLSWWINLVWT